ncbi:GNAT family N-acetyltransferase [Paenibacillus montanisoli]|uniref:GNAT family N-acetyltransferase n=2 Tax=Paenibacillus montanisoli TaxID=2081970 RepID=A0A328U7V7_9BACL|nr:GNAT family N-acetyltransferase [Paenibacillus montanisoli]
MKLEDAEEIISWRYEEPYQIYNNESTPELIQEMLNNYYTVYGDEKQIIGFFCAGNSAQVPNDFYSYSESYLDIGIGMRPELTNKGLGTEFFSFVLDSMNQIFGDVELRLTVTSFNQRARRLYRKFGFSEDVIFIKGSTEFIIMNNGTLNYRERTI